LPTLIYDYRITRVYIEANWRSKRPTIFVCASCTQNARTTVYGLRSTEYVFRAIAPSRGYR